MPRFNLATPPCDFGSCATTGPRRRIGFNLWRTRRYAILNPPGWRAPVREVRNLCMRHAVMVRALGDKAETLPR